LLHYTGEKQQAISHVEKLFEESRELVCNLPVFPQRPVVGSELAGSTLVLMDYVVKTVPYFK